MAIKGLIFDMDGTLIDSMLYWRNLRHIVCEYNKVPVSELDAFFANNPNWEEVRTYLTGRNGSYVDPKAFWQDCYKLLGEFYSTEVQPVPGVLEFLRAMKEKGYLLGVATATPKRVASLALEHLSILPLLNAVVSTKDLGVEKTEPDVYLECARMLGDLKKEEVVVFEDALYCVRTLRKHDFTVVGVHDPYISQTDWETLAPLCNRTVEDYRELL